MNLQNVLLHSHLMEEQLRFNDLGSSDRHYSWPQLPIPAPHVNILGRYGTGASLRWTQRDWGGLTYPPWVRPGKGWSRAAAPCSSPSACGPAPSPSAERRSAPKVWRAGGEWRWPEMWANVTLTFTPGWLHTLKTHADFPWSKRPRQHSYLLLRRKILCTIVVM